jgi:hypothetical protein
MSLSVNIKTVSIVLFGAVSFWAPTTIMEFVTKRELSLVVGSTVPVASILAAYGVTSQLKAVRRRYVSPWMLLGIWLFGPSFMMLGASALGGGFAAPGGIRSIWILLISTFVPIFTFVWAVYDVTILSLLFATLILLVLYNSRERHLS